jgi:hypothetical protein
MSYRCGTRNSSKERCSSAWPATAAARRSTSARARASRESRAAHAAEARALTRLRERTTGARPDIFRRARPARMEFEQGCSSVGRASASKSECRGFESCHPCQRYAPPQAACRWAYELLVSGFVPRWWNGRHAVLRGQCSFGRVSSNLTLGTIESTGAVAKWQGRALQKLHRRFESGRRLHNN